MIEFQGMSQFFESLGYMGIGMVGVMLITGINIGLIKLLNFCTGRKKK